MINIRDEAVLKSFGQHLAATRRKNGFSQKQLAMEADIETSQISRIERGNLNPTLSTLHTIAKALKIPLGKLCTFEKD